jgi:hypothetical protein
LRGSFPGHKQKRIAALVQHEYLREQDEGGELSASQAEHAAFAEITSAIEREMTWKISAA